MKVILLLLTNVNYKQIKRETILKKKELIRELNKILPVLIHELQQLTSSPTSRTLSEHVSKELGVFVCPDSIRYAIRRLSRNGEKILSFRNGILRGYRYSTSRMEYNACIDEQTTMVDAYSRKERKLIVERGWL